MFFKIDLVDKDWLDLVINDVKEYFKDSFLNLDDIFKISSTTNEGVDFLKTKLLNLNSSINNKFQRGVFRMFIDRSFLKTGFGSVVTGTVSSLHDRPSGFHRSFLEWGKDKAIETTFSIIEKSLNLSAQHPAAAKPQIQFTN